MVEKLFWFLIIKLLLVLDLIGWVLSVLLDFILLFI